VLDQRRYQGRRVLQVAVQHDHGVAAGLVDAGDDGCLMAETARHLDDGDVVRPIGKTLENFGASIGRRRIDHVDIAKGILARKRRGCVEQSLVEGRYRCFLAKYRADDVDRQHGFIASTTVLTPASNAILGRHPTAAAIAEMSATTFEISWGRRSARSLKGFEVFAAARHAAITSWTECERPDPTLKTSPVGSPGAASSASTASST
jgi:hypothetical protein